MYQKIILIGNLGKDPDMKMTPKGTSVCHVSLATNRNYTTGEGKEIKETTWWNITVWGKMAEAVFKYMHKGSKVYIEGHINPGEDGNPRLWQRQDKSTAASYDVTAEVFKFLDKAGSSSETPASNGEPETPTGDIPF